MRWYIVLERKSRNKLNADITRKKLKKIAAAAERNQSLGFAGRVGKLTEPELVMDDTTKDEVYRYLVRLRLEKPVVRSPEAASNQFEHILNVVSRCATSEGWSVLAKPRAAKADEQEREGPVEEHQEEFLPPILSEEVMRIYFRGVYDRDEHIRTIHDAVETMVSTNGELTNHILLEGLPGSCKTVLCERFKTFYEADGPKAERVAFVDGTTMSKAGLENWLLDLADSAKLPDILVVDELEKQPTENLSVLNGAMGSGILAKLNARISNKRTNVRFLVIGICNDVAQLQKTSLGRALWSRFSNKLRCVRPSKDLCGHILTEMVVKMPGGNLEWAEKAIEFGWEECGERDIRELKRHLSARERLMTGSWQEDQRRILLAKQTEDASVEISKAGG